jgi:anaerobic selenocysteine-containing dehydrogenase
MLGLLLRVGPYGAGLNPFGGGLTLRRLEEAPHGIDLGALEPCLPARLQNPGRRIALAPERLVADLPRLARARDAAVSSSLQLIGRRDLRSNNSWMHNSQRLVRGPVRCTLLMNPQDAASRGLLAGQQVRITARVGSVEAPLEITEAMMPGVVSLPHGWGHHRAGSRLRVAAERPGVSLNDLTDEQELDSLSGNARLSGVPIEVTAAS